MFSKDDLINYFSDRYPKEEIMKAVQILAEKRSDIDPNGNEFSEEIIEELEAIFDAIGAALDRQKKLAGNEPGGKIEIREATAIAQESLIAQNILISEESLMIIAQTMIGGILEQVGTLGLIAERVLLNSLQSEQERIAERVTAGMIESTKRIREVFNEENIQEIVKASVPESKPYDVGEFLQRFKQENEQREQSRKLQEARRREQVVAKKKLDIKAFLEEMATGKEG
ncbi:MAG: hypothetical protein KatS3mg087_0559 [Patescibacteria group bacterium]|nr:MAG: hypothetical protein KatS3mg087_0559 [Patescibacteria group bacterium]